MWLNKSKNDSAGEQKEQLTLTEKNDHTIGSVLIIQYSIIQCHQFWWLYGNYEYLYYIIYAYDQGLYAEQEDENGGEGGDQ